MTRPDAMGAIELASSGRTTWRGPQLQATGEWTRQLSREEIGDLDCALRQARARGVRLAGMTVEDFPLNAARPLLEEVSQELARTFQ
jgi:hypothetical protein